MTLSHSHAALDVDLSSNRLNWRLGAVLVANAGLWTALVYAARHFA